MGPNRYSLSYLHGQLGAGLEVVSLFLHPQVCHLFTVSDILSSGENFIRTKDFFTEYRSREDFCLEQSDNSRI